MQGVSPCMINVPDTSWCIYYIVCQLLYYVADYFIGMVYYPTGTGTQDENLVWSQNQESIEQRSFGNEQKGKAKNEIQETTFKDIGNLQKQRALLDKLTEALHHAITGESRIEITGCHNTTNLIRRKWRALDNTDIILQNPKHITKEEALQLQTILTTKEWAKRPTYG